MIELTVPDVELWDEQQEMFVDRKGGLLTLEHSLVSLSKWESQYQKPFLSKEEKTVGETIDYIRCMTLTEGIPPSLYQNLTEDNLRSVEAYIESPMTATTFRENPNRSGMGEQVTAELIYYWMITLGVPFECQYWHLNRLLTLIRVCTIKNQPKKHTSTRDIMRRNASMNAARRQKYHTRG